MCSRVLACARVCSRVLACAARRTSAGTGTFHHRSFLVITDVISHHRASPSVRVDLGPLPCPLLFFVAPFSLHRRPPSLRVVGAPHRRAPRVSFSAAARPRAARRRAARTRPRHARTHTHTHTHTHTTSDARSFGVGCGPLLRCWVSAARSGSRRRTERPSNRSTATSKTSSKCAANVTSRPFVRYSGSSSKSRLEMTWRIRIRPLKHYDGTVKRPRELARRRRAGSPPGTRAASRRRAARRSSSP